MDTYSLPEPLQDLIAGELAPGETARWVAQPGPRPLPCVTVLPCLLGIPWTLFALFWMATASGVFNPGQGPQGVGNLDPVRVVFALFGIPFVLIGVGMLTSPWWIKRRLEWAARRTVYVITDRRAILFDGGYGGLPEVAVGMPGLGGLAGKAHQIRSFGPGQLRDLQQIQREDGSGDIIFQSTAFPDGRGRVQFSRGGFFSIPDVREVERMLRELAARGESGPGDLTTAFRPK